MKKFMLVILVAVFALPFLNGCKKGPNDPAISLKSRDARITATWKLVKIEGTEQYVDFNDDLVTTNYSYDGTTYIETSPNYNISGTGAFEMTIDKDGVVSSKESFTSNNGSADVLSGKDTWYWYDNDNAKSSIELNVCGSDLFKTEVYIIDQLKSKELILHQISSDINNGKVSSIDIYYTFEAQ